MENKLKGQLNERICPSCYGKGSVDLMGRDLCHKCYGMRRLLSGPLCYTCRGEGSIPYVKTEKCSGCFGRGKIFY